MKNKELYKKYSTLLLTLLIVFLIIATIDPSITGLAPLRIEPLKELGNFLSTPVTLFGNSDLPVWAFLLSFAMIFSVVFVLVKKIHIFKDESNKAPAIIFSLALALLTVFATDIVGIIFYLATILTFLVIIATFLLVGWASYLGVHTSVSAGWGEIAQTGAGRDQARAAAKSAKEAYYQTATSYNAEKQEYKVLKDLGKSVYKQDKEAIKNLLNALDSLTVTQFNVNENVSKIMKRIERENLDPQKKAKVNPLVEDVLTLEEEVKSAIQEVRTSIEKIKASIKTNDFATAEATINETVGLQVDLDKIVKNIAKKEIEINGILLS